MRKKIVKFFFVFEIIATEMLALNCLYKAYNACHRQFGSNMLTTSLRILYITKRDFFERNYLDSY